MFVDEVVVSLRAGHGGNGCVSFRRERFRPRGGPDGGDGGDGGDIVLQCNENISDLEAFLFKSIWQAGNGQPGKGSDKYGRSGGDCLLKVPAGTVITNEETAHVAAELTRPAQRIRLLKGGKGGWGNIHFKSSVNRTPIQFKPGTEGEEGKFRFVLKTIADVGLVGFPNAGKSTLIGLLTHAHPKTAPYPFTTRNPNVGVIEFPETFDSLRMADIPGLLEGAHRNRGLGHQFLRHIERCRLLLIVIDMAAEDGRRPADDYRQLIKELELYDPDFLTKPRLVAANKMDEADAKENLVEFGSEVAEPVLAISCLTEEGIPRLLATLYELVKQGA